MNTGPRLTRWESRLAVAAFLLLSLGTGFGAGWIAGRFVDRDRDRYLPAIVEYFDMRSSSYDVESGTTFISPRQPRPDPAKGE